MSRFTPSRQFWWTAGTVLMIAGTPLTGSAQAVSPRSSQPAEPIGAIVGGLLGAGAGIVGGALMGYALECGGNTCRGDFGGYAGAVTGLLVGEALLLPIGVHLGNGGRGDLGKDIGVSVGVAAATLLLSAPADDEVILELGIIAQFALTVWAERSTGERAGRNVRVETRRFSNGRKGIGLNLTF